ncbi:RIP metalloprotease RseP [Prevotella sp. E9-3]|uniref:RIP metalloprotease RseP n=1 Tax=Prevotella sp. E9-3 TaxID=2913621 RepID=UPI001EDBFEA8|nr:RIP metalloprotease RseP [Prevotella sp. E9-3]UKK48673.1 RIP metalloprotease RseP [Prevotella sp. E9-3]
MTVLIQILQFVLALALLVLLHEFGHFFFSKLFGVRVEKFFLFFDLGIGKWTGKLFSHKPKNSDTEYGIGWLPLGGYCKIAGMIDESFDTEQMKQPEQPWEFRSKPAWQRLLIMIGGVLVNFLLALFIYSMIMFTWGEKYVALQDMSEGMYFNDEAIELGFQNGDILLSHDGIDFKEFGADMYRDISEAHEVTVLRDGKKVSISLPGDLNLLNMLKNEPRFVTPYIPAVIDSVLPATPASLAGLQKGDRIVAINDHEVTSYNGFLFEIGRLQDMLSAAVTPDDSMKVRTTTIVYTRAEVTDTASVVLTADLKLGFSPTNVLSLYEPTTVNYNFFESFPAGIKYGWNVLAGYVSDMKYVFTSDGAKSLGGFGTIGSLFPPMWDWYVFWKMTAFLSIILAFMNILPIPALDGGHVLFLLYEMITRRKPSEQFMIRAEYFGFGLIILLMVVANLNDVLRWIGVM